ncbi:MAG: hypothetical protein AAFP82_02990 [Bacteroidota bacterium]
MEYYFKLQFRRILRKLEAFGIQPVLGIVIALLTFIVLSKLLYYKLIYANWVYVAIACSVLLSLGNQKRNDLLKNIFSIKRFRQVRMLENIAIALPFSLYLIYEEEYRFVLGVLIAALLFAMVTFRSVLHFTIPTPFWKFPFEFIIGFRKFFLLILLGFFLTFQAIQVENPNLGVFSLGLQFLIALVYYNQAENPYFVWIFKGTNQKFLGRKMVDALVCSSIITFLIFSSLIFFFPSYFFVLIGVQLLGYVLLVAIILAKYSAYPSEMSLPQVLLYTLSLIFPPLFLVSIPIFYKQSTQKLKAFFR